MMNVLVVEAGKAPHGEEIMSGLESLQEVVGGPIETSQPFKDPVALVYNAKGKRNGYH